MILKGLGRLMFCTASDSVLSTLLRHCSAVVSSSLCINFFAAQRAYNNYCDCAAVSGISAHRLAGAQEK